MLEALSTKFLAGIMSLSMFLFSSYTGNDPSFRSLKGFVNNNYLQLSTSLDAAFDNDFPDVFKSGTPITMLYKVEIKAVSGVVFQKTYYNRCTYDAMKGSYKIYQSGMGQSQLTDSYNVMIYLMQQVSCSVPVEKTWGNVSVSLEAWLPTVEFSQINRKVDLMVLWKFRRPSVKANVNTRFSS